MNTIVSLDQSAVKAEIERQISLVEAGNYSMNYDRNLISAIDGVTDNVVKGELLQKLLEVVNQHQLEKNAALRIEVQSRIKINEEIAKQELETYKARSELFNNRSLVLFTWIFPVIAGFASIKYLDSFVFGTFIVIVLYGVLIALYFSHRNGLAETWIALTKTRRNL